MRSIDEWSTYRLLPQRYVEKALEDLYLSCLSPTQRKFLDRLHQSYRILMRIAECLASDLADAGEDKTRLVKEVEMSWEAKVWGFGPYTKEILDDLPYPNSCYARIEDGTILNGEFCSMCTESMSRMLASALGVETASMEWEIKSMNERVILDLSINGGDDSLVILEVVGKVRRLMSHGWRMFFDPNLGG